MTETVTLKSTFILLKHANSTVPVIVNHENFVTLRYNVLNLIIMNEKILVEPLRDRLYYASETCLTYIDSRVLVFYSGDLPSGMESRPEFISPHKYFILESGDLVPCNDLYDEECRLFSAVRFEHDEEIRKYAFECVIGGLIEDYYNDTETADEEFIVKMTVRYMDEIGIHSADRFNDEIRTVYQNVYTN